MVMLDKHSKFIGFVLMNSLLKVCLTISLMKNAGCVLFPLYALISVI